MSEILVYCTRGRSKLAPIISITQIIMGQKYFSMAKLEEVLPKALKRGPFATAMCHFFSERRSNAGNEWFFVMKYHDMSRYLYHDLFSVHVLYKSLPK